MSGATPRGTYLTIADVLRHELDAPAAARVRLSESEVQARFDVSRTWPTWRARESWWQYQAKLQAPCVPA